MLRPSEDLRAASANGDFIVFLGAGASRSMEPRCPLWQELTEGMIRYFEKQGGMGKNLAERARQSMEKHPSDFKYALDRLEEGNPALFFEGIRRVLEPALTPARNGLGLPQLLSILQPPTIITLSWDRLLDKTSDYELITWRDELREGWDLKSRFLQRTPTLFHLHGHVSRPDTLIATNSSYTQLYNTQRAAGSINQIVSFKDSSGPKGLRSLLEDDLVHVIVMGVNPANPEFGAILDATITGERSARFHVVAVESQLKDFENILQNRRVGRVLDYQFYGYPEGEHHNILEFLARLPSPRGKHKGAFVKTISDWRDHYAVFPNEERTLYLREQAELESMASEIWFATPRFTNVFGSDEYIRSIAKTAAEKSFDVPTEEHENAIYRAMIVRRDGIIAGLNSGRIKEVRCLYWEDSADTNERIHNAKSLFRGRATLHVRKMDIEAHSDKSPTGLSESFALVIGDKNAQFRLALCHAHQATAGTSSFQWIHVNTDITHERASWFVRAWQSGDDV